MNKNNTPVQCLRMDNAGENLLLERAIELDPVINTVVEYTPRNCPQCNGRVERKYAWLHGKVYDPI